MVAGRVGARAGRPAHHGAHDTRGIHRGDGRPSERPGARSVGVATRIAGRGTARAGIPRSVAWPGRGHRRSSSPWRVAERGAMPRLALVLPALNDWAAKPEALDPIRFTALHVVDDVAYGVGVWAGCARERCRSHCCHAWCGGREHGPPSRCANPSEPGPPRSRRVTPWRNEPGRAGAPSRRPPRTERLHRSTRRRSCASGGHRAPPGAPQLRAAVPVPVRLGGVAPQRQAGRRTPPAVPTSHHGANDLSVGLGHNEGARVVCQKDGDGLAGVGRRRLGGLAPEVEHLRNVGGRCHPHRRTH